jgi:carboxypeptidase PM20D1
MRKIIAALGLGLVFLLGFTGVRFLMFTPPPIVLADPVAFEIDADKVAQHLSEAVKFQTVSPPAPNRRDAPSFERFLVWAAATYPELHALETTKVAEHTLLMKWQGTRSDLKPVLLAAHYDVVPVVPGTEGDWIYPPFDGVIADGMVWGRGALDDKSGVIVMMEAATHLLKQGFQPKRTLYFAFDHDEEVGGREGAAGVAALLKSQGIQLAWSIDEGSFILQDMYPGMDLPIASINVAEKGYMTLDLIARGQSGHSSMPSSEASIFLLAAAIQKLRETPLPGSLEGVSLQTMDVLARYRSPAQRYVFANQWLFKGFIEGELSKQSQTNPMLRTTTAPTMLSAGIKDNVLPGTATATVNFRLHPRDTPDGVIAMVKEIIEDERIEIRSWEKGSLASRVSRTDGLGFEVIAKTARQVFGPLVVVPGMTGAGTNSKHYEDVADDAYRINLLTLGPEDLAGFHGTNERIAIENLAKGTAAYAQLITLGTGSTTN